MFYKFVVANKLSINNLPPPMLSGGANIADLVQMRCKYIQYIWILQT